MIWDATLETWISSKLLAGIFNLAAFTPQAAGSRRNGRAVYTVTYETYETDTFHIRKKINGAHNGIDQLSQSH